MYSMSTNIQLQIKSKNKGLTILAHPHGLISIGHISFKAPWGIISIFLDAEFYFLSFFSTNVDS